MEFKFGRADCSGGFNPPKIRQKLYDRVADRQTTWPTWQDACPFFPLARVQW